MPPPLTARRSRFKVTIYLALFVATLLGAARAFAAQSGPATSAPAATTSAEFQQCLADLRTLKVEFAEVGSAKREGCTVEGAVQLSAMSSAFGRVLFTGKPILACPFAKRFIAWVGEIGAPLTLAYLGSKLTALDTGPGFVCRNRYGRSDEKVSEHAKGDAIDIAAFGLENGKKVTVKDASASVNSDGVLMRSLRTAACGYFTTVLGPGSNEAHKDHLHFDHGLHGQTDNYRICE